MGAGRACFILVDARAAVAELCSVGGSAFLVLFLDSFGQCVMAEKSKTNEVQQEELPLSVAAQYLLEECRMVLPGIQALFGFQLIVVFNPGFSQKLSAGEQRLHLLAIILL